ncbi:hypothetical protein LAX5112_01160 [Roseibium alexandrii]|uniref:Uncharacterized protein n=1 Tax=Roseibium alexandrii TaxID=388408 RepID=A0A0M6ZXF0_9HYPH|nr:hypothetical protein LAX5112_01160 [Roseibium alexandrii]
MIWAPVRRVGSSDIHLTSAPTHLIVQRTLHNVPKIYGFGKDAVALPPLAPI